MRCNRPTLTDSSADRPPKLRPLRWRGGIAALVLAMGPSASTAEPFGLTPPVPAAASDPSVRGDPVVATDQSEAPEHRATTQAIRRALMSDESLSFTAQNVIVVTTSDGTVTVQGSVKDAREKAVVASIARRIAPGAVVDRLEVETP